MPAASAARASSSAKRVRRRATRGIGNAAFAANGNSRERPACRAQGHSPNMESCLLTTHTRIPQIRALDAHHDETYTFNVT